MSWVRVEAPERSELDEALRGSVPLGRETLEVLMRGLPGPAGPVDWIGHDAAGTPVLVRFAAAGEGLRALAALLAERTWLSGRLQEWRALQPTLPLRAGRGVRCLLLSPEPEAALRAAAEAVGARGIELVRVVAVETADGRHLALQTLEPTGTAVPPPHRDVSPLAPTGSAPRAGARSAGEDAAVLRGPAPAGFRTGLREEDLALAGRPRNAPRSRP